ncbi:Uncharacterised protein [Neisseria meningitidis]|nr:Uncharacterised protein [Neisseria meningitidis]
MRQISLTDYFCKGLYLFDIFEDIVFLGKRLFTVRKFLDFSELLEMVNTQGYLLIHYMSVSVSKQAIIF